MPWKRFAKIWMLTSNMSTTSRKAIVLVGFMGAGKSTVGRALANLSGLPLVDLDALIVKQQGDTISAIFADQGEAAFRCYETEALRSLGDACPIILATGGGIVGLRENWQLMRRLGPVIYLRANWQTLRARLAGSTDRPLATAERAEADVKSLWQQRVPLYEQADVIVDTDGRTVEEVVREILTMTED
jgi:shikimate kinase